MRTVHGIVPDNTVERLLARLKPHLVRILAESKVPSQDAEDLLQETLVALLFKWNNIHNHEAWLLTTLRNRCNNYHLRQDKDLDEGVQTPPDSVQPPQQEVAEVRHDFQRVYARLPRRQRQVIQLRYRGFRNDEVAEQLGLEPEGARHLTNVTLASLTRELHQAGLVF
ncbi:MAG: sigma-70 family RNA polymerase sigma factor [Thermoanaerobaculia bacterium]|nr:sigma-70 family RNA polymerase sigma factor [Thermoanaerobaculia bacterium]